VGLTLPAPAATALLEVVLLPTVVVGVRLLLPSVVLAEGVREGEGAARDGVTRPGVPKRTAARQTTDLAHLLSYKMMML
jgi:hypothetical protein